MKSINPSFFESTRNLSHFPRHAPSNTIYIYIYIYALQLSHFPSALHYVNFVAQFPSFAALKPFTHYLVLFWIAMEAKLATATEGQPLRCKGMPCHDSWKQYVLYAFFFNFFR